MNYPQLRRLLPKKTQKWTMSDVSTWLHFIHLDTCIPLFQQACVDGSCLKLLSETDIMGEIGVRSRIMCKKLLNWILNGLDEFDASFEGIQEASCENEESMGLDQWVKTQDNQYSEAITDISLRRSLKKKQIADIMILKRVQAKQNFYYKFKERDCRIGTDPNAEIQIDVDMVQPFHVHISCRAGQYYLRRASPQATTFIKIDSRVPIQNGMQVEMGSNVFQFTMDSNMRLQVKIVQGANDNYTFKFPNMKNKIMIGRKSTNDISFPHDITLSNLHARLTYVDLVWYIEDLVTTNGSWIEITKEVRLVSGVVFKLGLTNVQFQCDLRQVRETEEEECSIVVEREIDEMCRKCGTNVSNILFIPCSHCAVCEECNKDIKVCLICSKPVKSMAKIFKA